MKTCTSGIKCEAYDQYRELFPSVSIEVCEESDGELCLSTNIAYTTCGAAEGMERELCGIAWFIMSL